MTVVKSRLWDLDYLTNTNVAAFFKRLLNFRSLNRTLTSVLQQLGRESRISSEPGLCRHHVFHITSFSAARDGHRAARSRFRRVRSSAFLPLDQSSTGTEGRCSAILPLLRVQQTQQPTLRVRARPNAAATCTTPRPTSRTTFKDGQRTFTCQCVQSALDDGASAGQHAS